MKVYFRDFRGNTFYREADTVSIAKIAEFKAKTEPAELMYIATKSRLFGNLDRIKASFNCFGKIKV